VFDEIEMVREVAHAGHRPSRFELRDLRTRCAIAEFVAQMKETYGYPRYFGVSYAKNTVKHLQHIIQTISPRRHRGAGDPVPPDDGRGHTRGGPSFEHSRPRSTTCSPARCAAPISRCSGSHAGSSRLDDRVVHEDLQQCIEREVQVRIPQTTLPRQQPHETIPEYRAEHKIEVQQPLAPGRPSLVVSTATFTRQDYSR